MLDPRQRLCRDRVEIANEQIDRPAQLRSTVGSDHRRTRRQLNPDRRLRPPGQHDDGLNRRPLLDIQIRLDRYRLDSDHLFRPAVLETVNLAAVPDNRLRSRPCVIL